MKEDPVQASNEVKSSQAPATQEAKVTKLEPRRKSAGKPKVRQNLKGPKIGRGTRITKPTFGNVTSTFY